MKNTKFKTHAALLATLIASASPVTGWTKTFESCPKTFLEQIPDRFKDDINNLDEDKASIQDYLDKYDWSGLVNNEATYGAVTLSNLQLNGRNKAVVVEPGKKIVGIVHCSLDRDKVSSMHLYRVVIGIRGKGAQTTIGNELGMAATDTAEKFTLVAPAEPGIYQVCFRLVESGTEEAALTTWIDRKGAEPDSSTAIGVILVKP